LGKSRPDKKRERNAGGQLPLPAPQQAATPAATRVLPMQLRIGDRLTDATGEWEVVGHPYTTNAGKNVHVRVHLIEIPRRSKESDDTNAQRLETFFAKFHRAEGK